MTFKPSELLIREVGDLHLLEAATGGDGPFNPDGTVNVAILRPCKGRGPGSRIYTSQMLQEAAGTFAGWPMYVNHDSPAARRARAGLPRPPSELGGEIRESWWDPSYTTPEDAQPHLNYLPGAVVGKFMPATQEVEEMIRRIPRQIKLSVNATATGLRRATLPELGEGALVEGIVNDPENSSVDLVTKAGAGGHVRQLLEAVYSGEGDPPNDPDPEGDDMKLSEALRQPEVRNYIISEVLGSDEGKALIEAAVEERVEERVAAFTAADSRDAELRRLETKARALIEAERLPERAKALLVEDYSFEDDRPGRSLALVEAVRDGAGTVTTPAEDVLKTSIERDAKRLREAVGGANPTVPFVPGGGGGDGGDDPSANAMTAEGSFASQARGMGLDPAHFGVKQPEPAKT